MSQSKQLSIKATNFSRLIMAAGLLAVLFLPVTVLAETIGVAVGTGKIELDQPVKPSLTYDMPSIVVFNNGDVTSDYEMTVQYNETQPELKPPADWVTFSPARFNLEPNKSQKVDIILHPDYSAKPGKYFAYLEARPLKKDTTGESAVSVAAATKFSFEVIPANFLMRIYYALLAFWLTYKAVIIPVLAALVIAILVYLAKRYLNIEIKRKKQEKKDEE